MLPDRNASDEQLSNLDGVATLALCKTLADYGEAGALSHELMLRVGEYATSRFGGDLDILLAVARMYQLGDEAELARTVLLRAGKLDVPSRPTTRSIPPPSGADLRKRPSQRPTRQIAMLRPEEELPPYDRSEDARAPAGMQTIPVGLSSNGTPRAGTRPENTPTLQMRSQRPEPPSAEDRRTDGALRLRTLESPSPPEVTRSARSNRIRMLDPHDPTRQLDRYELIGEIASGGMATVFLARRDGAGGFQRLVAIKRLHPHLAHQQEFVEMFLDEARLAAAIHHPHVVPILESENGSYVVMEFIEGDTLAGLAARALDRGVMLPRAVALRIVLDALAGLHAAHQLKDGEGRLLGLVHRDCTPQNILVGSDGSSRLTDFGVARAASRLTITRSQMVKGKIAYLSPEQATAGELDRRSDLFTMGIVLWEALAGQPLFLTDNESMTITRLLNGPIPSVRQYAPDVSPELEEVCARALQRRASQRYPTAAAMAEALEAAARTAIGGAASPAEVGRCVEMLLGVDLAAQREAVRAWSAQNESGPESRRRGGTSETPSVSPPPLPPTDVALVTSVTSVASVTSVTSEHASTPHRSTFAKPLPMPAAPESTVGAVKPPSAAAILSPTSASAVARTDAKKRMRTRLTVAAIVFVGVSSPLWVKPVAHLREKLFAHGKTPAGAERPRRAP